ncbi:hypothetical protein QAD02_000712 [Eretmocerus hayati]|uniref:Uncharacterized protein n=1 Tax=Eretmocerus hayati TaxID=131215 RepID=A0ACC2NF83_9HYME|nr:hypothetical protein QAD02_000712 [Eretmocerus hayati]
MDSLTPLPSTSDALPTQPNAGLSSDASNFLPCPEPTLKENEYTFNTSGDEETPVKRSTGVVREGDISSCKSDMSSIDIECPTQKLYLHQSMQIHPVEEQSDGNVDCDSDRNTGKKQRKKHSKKSKNSKKNASKVKKLSSKVDQIAQDVEELKSVAKRDLDVEIGTYDLYYRPLSDAYCARSPHDVRTTIWNFMLKQEVCTCSLYLNSIRFNKSRSITSYGRCVSGGHKQYFSFRFMNIVDGFTRLIIKSDATVIYVHENTENIKGHGQCRGEERKLLAKESKHRSAFDVMNELVADTDTALATDGHCQQLRSYIVLAKMRIEANIQGRLKLESVDLNDLFELWIQQEEETNQFIRKVELPFSVIMMSDEANATMLDGKDIIVLGDATGVGIRPPDHYPRSKRILMYELMYRYTKTAVTLATYITDRHDIYSIPNFSSFWEGEVERTEGNPLKRVVAVTFDWSWPQILAFFAVFNDGISVNEYLELMYMYFTTGMRRPRFSRPPLILLEICYSHFMKL